jgi:WD40 repeat protein
MGRPGKGEPIANIVHSCQANIVKQGHTLLGARTIATIDYLKKKLHSRDVSSAQQMRKVGRGQVGHLLHARRASVHYARHHSSLQPPASPMLGRSSDDRQKLEHDVWEVYTLRHAVLHALESGQQVELCRAICDLRYVELKTSAEQTFELAKEFNAMYQLTVMGSRKASTRDLLSNLQTSLHQNLLPQESQAMSLDFYRFTIEFGRILKKRPHLTLQCAANWPADLAPTVQSKSELESPDRQGYIWLEACEKTPTLSPLLLTLHFDGGPVLAVDITSDGSRVAAGGGEGLFRIWDAVSGERLQVFHHLQTTDAKQGFNSVHNSVVFDLKFLDIDGNLVISAGGTDNEGFSVKIWDSWSAEVLVRIKDKDITQCRSVFPSLDGSVVATASTGDVKVWDASTGEEVQRMVHGEKEQVICVAYTPNNALIASGVFTAPRLYIWDAATGEQLRSLKHERESRVWAVAFSSCGTKLASVGKSVHLWDAVDGTLLMRFSKGETIRSVLFVGRSLVVGGHDGFVRMWDVEAETQELKLATIHTTGDVYCCSCTTTIGLDERPVVSKIASGGSDGALKIWTVDARQHQRLIQDADVRVQITSLDVSPDGTKFASGAFDGVVKVWSMNTAEELQCFVDTTLKHVEEVQFSPCGSKLACASGIGAAVIIIFDVKTGANLLRVDIGDVSGGLGGCLDFSPCGRRLMAGSTTGAHVCDASTGEEVLRLDTTTLCSTGGVSEMKMMARGHFSPCGSDIATVAGGDIIAIWCAGTGIRKKTWKQERTVTCMDVRYSTDGSQLVTCGQPGSIQIWNVATGEELSFIQRGYGKFPNGAVYPIDLCFSPCGTKVIAGGSDAMICTVKGNDLEQIVPLNSRHSSSWRTCLSSDGSTVIMASRDGNLYILRLDDGSSTARLDSPTSKEVVPLYSSVQFAADLRSSGSSVLEKTVCQAHQPEHKVTICALPGRKTVSVTKKDVRSEIDVLRITGQGRLRCKIHNGTSIQIVAGEANEVAYVDTEKSLEIVGFVLGSTNVLAVTVDGEMLEFRLSGLLARGSSPRQAGRKVGR